MTVSTTHTFGIDTPVDEVIAEAFERIGMDPAKISGYQLDSARRSMQLTWVDWSNRPVNLWKVTQYSYPLTQGQTSTTLLPQQLFITEAFTRQVVGGNNQDLMLSPISRAEYAALPNKAQQGNRPTEYYLQRTITPVIYWWPTPQDTSVTVIVNTMDFQFDVGAYANTLDAPQRWFEALCAGTAFRLAQKFAPGRLTDTKTAYDEAYAVAAAEDTENVPMRIVPDMSGRRLA